eukprot:SAG31_NODE_605_length_13628_cov_24.848030_7_plen_250_part_00
MLQRDGKCTHAHGIHWRTFASRAASLASSCWTSSAAELPACSRSPDAVGAIDSFMSFRGCSVSQPTTHCHVSYCCQCQEKARESCLGYRLLPYNSNTSGVPTLNVGHQNIPIISILLVSLFSIRDGAGVLVLMVVEPDRSGCVPMSLKTVARATRASTCLGKRHKYPSQRDRPRRAAPGSARCGIALSIAVGNPVPRAPLFRLCRSSSLCRSGSPNPEGLAADALDMSSRKILYKTSDEVLNLVPQVFT